MTKKTLATICYLISEREGATVTELMKLCYLADLISIAANKKKRFTDFEYVRWFYGPFDKNIYVSLGELSKRNQICTDLEHTAAGSEVTKYKFCGDKKYFSDLSDEDRNTLDILLGEVSEFGPTGLTKIAYSTFPLKKMGVKIGDNKKIGEKIDLRLPKK